MANGQQSNSEPIEPDRVWTAEEWAKDRPYIRTGSPTGRFKITHPFMNLQFDPLPMPPMPQPGDRIRMVLEDGEVVEFDFEA